LLHFANKDLDYDAHFFLYMTTQQPNPAYNPEVFIKASIINFTATIEGLAE